jgi:hypothetical protein
VEEDNVYSFGEMCPVDVVSSMWSLSRVRLGRIALWSLKYILVGKRYFSGLICQDDTFRNAKRMQ